MATRENNHLSESPARGELIIYPGKDGHPRLEARLVDGMLWLNQKQIAELFGVDLDTITVHLKNVFNDKELQEATVIREFETNDSKGEKYRTGFYHLEAVIAVGYRVDSVLAKQFRQWATQLQREYIIKGFTLDDERLKNPSIPGFPAPDHFDELLERIRDIRASERRMYLRVREIFTLAVDYQPSLPETTSFFQAIQNKLHFAVTRMTAPEIIASRIDHRLPNAGLTTWAGNEVRKRDVTIAKNYLKENEISELNRIVTMWLDFAEDQAKRRKQVFMSDWEQKLDDFLRFNDREVLPHLGKITREDSNSWAHTEYDKFAELRRSEKEETGYSENIHALEATAKSLAKQGNKPLGEKKSDSIPPTKKLKKNRGI